MDRRLTALASIAFAAPALAATPSLTLTNLKGPIARICNVAPAKSIAELWRQIDGCNVPAPAPSPPPSLLAKDVPTILANFPTAPWLKPATIPGTMGSDPVGAFRLICQTSWLAAVDPLVEPGVKPSMHLHFGWGNDALDQDSTYDTLRAKGGSNCQGGPLYRSAGWAPALLDGDEVILPDFISTYYKRLPASDPNCFKIAAKGCAPFPAGLRFVVGRAYATGLANGTGNNVSFMCAGVSSGVRSWVEAAKGCPAGRQMEALVVAPDCWDGERIDAPDHQSHLAYQRRDQNTGRLSCPASHPVLIPQYTVSIFWTIGVGEDPTEWTFSLNRMMGTPAGEGFHIDYWEAQEPSIREAWNRECIDKHLNCSGGVLGDGRGFVDPPEFSFKAKVRRVAVPFIR